LAEATVQCQALQTGPFQAAEKERAMHRDAFGDIVIENLVEGILEFLIEFLVLLVVGGLANVHRIH
jgi:hypothetical protein